MDAGARVISADDDDEADRQLVTLTYDACWRVSRGRNNDWIEGRISPLARRFYLVVNATERCLIGGVPSLLEERRFGLAETVDAFEHFELWEHAQAVRRLRETTITTTDVDRPIAHSDKDARAARERAVLALTDEAITQLNRSFPTNELELWPRLANLIRRRRGEFPTA